MTGPSDDELGRRLAEALHAQARHAVGDDTAPPPPRFLDRTLSAIEATPAPHRRARVLAPLFAAAAVIALVVALAAVLHSSGPSQRHQQVAGRPPARAASLTPSPTPTTSPSSKPGTPVHVSLRIADGTEVGVGMPVIATFKTKITSGVAIEKATTVTVNGKPASGAWYFENSVPSNGWVMEAHFRLKDYWPANSTIHLNIPIKGLSAGRGLYYDNNLTSTFTTGSAHIATVNDKTHLMTVTNDGAVWGIFPVSLGAANTPTASGVKVIMEKGASICMKGPGYSECGIKYTQRLTYGGEYLHAAPWNVANIRHGVDSSNGCTNLLPADAARLYTFLRVGDVVQFPNASGPTMKLGAGYGDWNVPWNFWLTGGVVPTR